MRTKSVFFIVLCFFYSLLVASCSNLLKLNDGETSLSVYLPYAEGKGRAAVGVSYNYVVTYVHESGEKTVLEGKSGDNLSLKPAEVGKYEITGEAYNDSKELIFQGTAEAEVEEGKDTTVILSLKRMMYELENQTEHMSLYPDKQGIKIVLNAVEGEADWSTRGFRLIENTSKIELELHESPSKKKPMVLYFPFTEKGNSYTFELSFKNGTKEVVEKATCKAAGGENDYFDFTDYLKTEIDLGSSVVNKDTMKISYDVTKAVKESKITDKKFLDIGIIYSIFSGKRNGNYSEYIGTDILTNYSTEGFAIDYSPILTELNLTEQLSHKEGVNFEKLKENGSWYADLALRFRLAEFPEQDFIGPYIFSEDYTYKKGIQNSKHVSVEPDEKGIKVTFKYSAEDGIWGIGSKLEISDGKYNLNFNENAAPTSDNPEVVYYIGITEEGQFYEYNFILKSLSGTEIAKETVGCFAGGGNSDLIHIPDSWDGYDFELQIQQEQGIVVNKSNIGGDVFGITLGMDVPSFVTPYSALSFDIELYAGEYNAPERLTYVKTRCDAIYDNGGTSVAEAFNMLVSDKYPIYFNEDLGTFKAEKLFGARDKWSLKFRFNVGIKNTDTILSLYDMLIEKNYEGERVEYDYVIGTRNLDAVNGWELFYSCPENIIPEYEFITSSENGFVINITSMDSVLEETSTYHFIIRRKLSSGELSGTYSYSLNYLCNSEGYISPAIYDENMLMLNNSFDEYDGIDVGTQKQFRIPSFEMKQGKTYYVGVGLYKPGEHTISDFTVDKL